MTMLPEFDENGNLPPGVHRCSLEELEARFGRGSPEREVETAELREFIAWARQAGIKRLLVDGSYVTRAQAPNDVDVVILPGEEHPEQAEVALDSANRWPFVHIMVAVDEADLEQWAVRDFGTDRGGTVRGIVEVDL
jgi:hypothetical protein